jgi:predicted amidohydrolase YtcJ
MLQMGVPVGAGTDATRVASYNPFVCLYWLVTGKTLGGTPLSGEANRLDRMAALRLWTVGSAWFSGDGARKGTMAPGQLADLAVLSGDYFSVPEEQIKGLESLLTLVGGQVVHAAQAFGSLHRTTPRPPQLARHSRAAPAASRAARPLRGSCRSHAPLGGRGL